MKNHWPKILLLLSFAIFFRIAFTVSLNSNVADISTHLTVYPNPVSGNCFTVVSNSEISEVALVNVLGQQVLSKSVQSQKKIKITIDTRENGLYILQVKTADNRVITKRVLFK